jgi:hypothetical protein
MFKVQGRSREVIPMDPPQLEMLNPRRSEPALFFTFCEFHFHLEAIAASLSRSFSRLWGDCLDLNCGPAWMSGKYERTIREFMMTMDGIRVGKPLREFQEILPRFPSEMPDRGRHRESNH